MFALLRYLPKIIFGFKDISAEYKEATGEGRPWYYSRGFIHSVICFAGTMVTAFVGITIDPKLFDVIADNATILLPAAISLITAVMSIIGQIRSVYNGANREKAIRDAVRGKCQEEGNSATVASDQNIPG